MAYVDPNTVDSPKKRWQCSTVLINTGQGGWSAADGVFDERECLVLRWNGSDSDGSTGSPQSRGHPTWFVVPDELTHTIRREIDMLAKSNGIVICDIARPEGYHDGAFRIEATLGSQIIKKLERSELAFSLPDLPKRLCLPEQGYVRANEEGLLGSFIDGKWFGNLYSNGISETKNPVTVDAFRDAFIQNVTQAVQRAGLLK